MTNSQDRPNPFGDAIDIKPLAFDNPDTLTKSLEGADVLYNTYWVRFKLSGTSLLQRKKSKVLCGGLLDSDQQATGSIKLTEWAKQHRETLGRRYASEVGRRTKRKLAYEHV